VEADGEEEVEIFSGFGAEVTLKVEDQCDIIEPKVTDWARNTSKQLYRDLEKYYTELTSDKTIEEFLKSGGYRFDENGNIS
jgi:hypothetical protein